MTLVEYVLNAIDSMNDGEIKEVPASELPEFGRDINFTLEASLKGFVRPTHHGPFKTVRAWVQYGHIFDKWGNAYAFNYDKPIKLVIMKNVNRRARRDYLGYDANFIGSTY